MSRLPVVVLVVITALVGGCRGQDNKRCLVTGAPPKKTFGITFCETYTDNACCTPATDAENEEMFRNLVNVGASCRLRGDIRRHPMAEFYCLNCDPDQSNFINTDVNNTVYICQEWVDRVFGAGDRLFQPHNMNSCGFMVASECTESQSGDRYQCGDDPLIPLGKNDVRESSLYDTVSEVSELLNYKNIGPPLFESGYTFRLVSKAEVPSGKSCFDGAVGRLWPSLLLVAATLVASVAAALH